MAEVATSRTPSPRRAVGAIVLAAGSGARMGSAKQFLELGAGERLVDRAIGSVASVASWVGLVLPADTGWDGVDVDVVMAGGDSRYESLANGLRAVPVGVDIVVVHSASHPLASSALAGALIDTVERGADAAVPFLAAVDVIKRRAADGTLTTVGRETLGAAQCPMAFDRSMLDRAFAEAEPGIEESALVEAIGGTIVGVTGEVGNVHVVDAASLGVARTLAKTGVSSHQLGPCSFGTEPSAAPNQESSAP